MGSGIEAKRLGTQFNIQRPIDAEGFRHDVPNVVGGFTSKKALAP